MSTMIGQAIKRNLPLRLAQTRNAATATAAKRVYTRSPPRSSATTPSRAAAPIAAASTPSVRTAQEPPSTSFELDYDVDDLPLPEIPPMPSVSSAARASPSPTSPSSLPSTSTSIPSNNALPSTSSIPLNAAPYPTEGATPASIPSSEQEINWATSFHGLSSQPFSEKAATILMRPLMPNEIEIKPDGLLYLPEILYRRILNQALGPGGWGMVPRGELTVLNRMVSREWGLVAGGRLVSVARGEQAFFDPSGLPTATEGCKSNALMRCCKDLGIASELWDPSFIRKFKTEHCVEAWTEHASSKKKQKRWRKKGNKFDYPLLEVKG